MKRFYAEEADNDRLFTFPIYLNGVLHRTQGFFTYTVVPSNILAEAGKYSREIPDYPQVTFTPSHVRPKKVSLF